MRLVAARSSGSARFELEAFPTIRRALIGLAMVAAASSTANAGESDAQEQRPQAFIRLDRTSCFGECPVYSVTIDASGNVDYEGVDFVRVKGRRTDRIAPARVQELLELSERIRFFELRDRYKSIRNADGTETIVTDLPTAFVTITRGGRTKRIEDYVGAPPPLKALEERIDDAARTRRWVRIDASTVRQMLRDGERPSLEELAELLRKALQYDDVDVVRALLEIGADPNWSYYGTNTPPLFMIRSAAAARALLDAGAVPFVSNDHGTTPLSIAARLAPDVTDLLIKAGVRVDDVTDSDGRTALFDAACAGSAGAVALLLRAGANPRVQAGGVSAAECARSGKAMRRGREALDIGVRARFVEDYDAVITLLEQGIAKRPGR